MTGHEPMNNALVERVARAIAGELGKQDFGEPFELKADLKLAYLDQGEVDFTLVARAAIEASGITALTDRVEQLREIGRIIQRCDGLSISKGLNVTIDCANTEDGNSLFDALSTLSEEVRS